MFQSHRIVRIVIALVCLSAAGYFVAAYCIAASVRITAVVPGVCGNGFQEVFEQCDGEDFGGASCVTLGYSGGSLSCSELCTFDVAQCTEPVKPPVTPPPGGGGDNGNPGISGVVFIGRAYPLSKVTILKDGQLAVNTIAGPDAKFSVQLAGISTGNYIFSVYGTDSKDRKSTLFTFPMYISSGSLSTVSGIFLSPTIDVDKSEVRKGDNISIFGQSVPDGDVTISVHSDEEYFPKIKADSNGAYVYTFDTSPLELGKHETKSKAAVKQDASDYSPIVSFAVGNTNVTKKRFLKGDLNDDGHVNLVDFSIAAYWYKKQITPAFAKIEDERLNGDGVVDLTDFSIMAYYWTG